MDLFNNKKMAQLVENSEKQVVVLRENLDKLETRSEAREAQLVKKVQYLVDDILSIQDESGQYASNEYRNYNTAISEIRKKNNALAKWGVLLTNNIISVRSAFIIGKGLKVVKTETGTNDSAEVQWSEKFMEMNDMNLFLPMMFSTEGEIEAKFLARLFIDKVDEFKMGDSKDVLTGMIKVRHYSYQNYKYTIEADPMDYLRYIKAVGRYEKKKEDIELSEDEFTYRKWGGDIFDPNSASPKIWKVLSKIDDLDKALRDLREINRLFASPIPISEHEKFEDAKAAKESFDENIGNFKIKKLWFTTGQFRFAAPGVEGVQNIINEIIMIAKMISGSTGVPVHFLGLPDLMSNRATAQNLMELVWASTKADREVWESAYNEILRKSMIMYNLNGRTPLDPDKVKIVIPEVSDEKWAQLVDFWLPAYNSGSISLELFLSKIPDINDESELKKAEEEEQKLEAKQIPPDQEQEQFDDQENKLIKEVANNVKK